MAARLRRLAELREGLARRDRVQARRELEFAEVQLQGLDTSHAQAEKELLNSGGPLTGAHMRLLQDGRLSHRGWRRMREAVVKEREEEHALQVTAHERAIGEQRGKEALEDRTKRDLREEFERQESRELDEISATRAGSGPVESD
jgi:hypothetical protein